MKMEASITAPVGGVVERLAIDPQQQVEGGDLLIVIRKPREPQVPRAAETDAAAS